jgi:hypothetical protein
MSSVALLEKVAPEFVDDARADFALEEAATLHAVAPWGAAYALAMAYYAAHTLTMQDRAAAGGASGGEVTARSAGDLSESYATSATAATSGSDFLTETIYGRKYLSIRRSRSASGPQIIRPTV